MTAAEKIAKTQGLHIETTVAVEDFEALGRWWADLDSEQQALFLCGVAEGFAAHESGVPQQAFIGSTARAMHIDTRPICLWAQSLADQMEAAS